jgi:hypothetical protein
MRWNGLIVLTTCVLAACATTQSPERQRRISDCLANCKAPKSTAAHWPLRPERRQTRPEQSL